MKRLTAVNKCGMTVRVSPVSWAGGIVMRRWMRAAFCAALLLAPGELCAAPVGVTQARKAAVAYAAGHAGPASVASATQRAVASAAASGATNSTRSISGAKGTVGFAVALAPAGFVVVRADDDLPPVKLQVEKGAYEDLPAGFRAVIEAELAGELSDLAVLRQAGATPEARFHSAWQSLTAPSATTTLSGSQSSQTDASGTVLLTTTWDQSDPYNDYAPAAPGGSDGRAYAGCGPCALAQILRYHKWPIGPIVDYTYTDNVGDCTGTYSLSAVGGLAGYDWANMPNSVSSSSALVRQQAVGRLMYHCGVAMQADFEADGTSIYSDPDAVSALRDVFAYTCGDMSAKQRRMDAAWYAKIQTDIDSGLPIYYTMQSIDGGTCGCL